MIVVSDASPLNYLVLIDAAHVLPALFGNVIIPQAVYDELSTPSAPDLVRHWIAHRPDGLLVRRAIAKSDPELQPLDSGEREVILLAEDLRADLIILDERAARQIATRRGLRVTGTLGVLNFAGHRDLLDITETVARLQRTSFRAAPKLYKWLLDQQGSGT